MGVILTGEQKMLNVTLSGTARLDVTLSNNKTKTLEVALSPSGGDVRLLPLHLTPTIDAQSVNAEAGRAFSKVDMDGIPYYEFSNEYGTTISIG